MKIRHRVAQALGIAAANAKISAEAPGLLQLHPPGLSPRHEPLLEAAGPNQRGGSFSTYARQSWLRRPTWHSPREPNATRTRRCRLLPQAHANPQALRLSSAATQVLRKARRQREIATARLLAAPAQGITAPASTTNQSEHSPRRYDPTPPPRAARRGGCCLRGSRNPSTVRLSFATTTRPCPKRRWAVVSRHRGPKRKTNRPNCATFKVEVHCVCATSHGISPTARRL